MAQVRIEVDFDVPLEGGVESAGTARVELDDPSSDLAQLLERANGAMLRLLPQKETTKAEPQTILTLNNVRFTDAVQDTLFGRVMAPVSVGVPVVNSFTAKVAPRRKGQCQDHCPQDEAGHPPCRCELPLGHASKHRAHSTGHGWPNPAGEDPGGVIPAECGAMLRFGNCPKPKGHDGKCVDNGRCASTCPEPHRPPQQCALADRHRGPHESGEEERSERCAWSDHEAWSAHDETKEEPERCGDRVWWQGVGYGCERYLDHPDHHESALGLKWEMDGQLMICGGEWGYEVTSPLSGGLACRLPEGHEGDCGPLPPDTMKGAESCA